MQTEVSEIVRLTKIFELPPEKEMMDQYDEALGTLQAITTKLRTRLILSQIGRLGSSLDPIDRRRNRSMIESELNDKLAVKPLESEFRKDSKGKCHGRTEHRQA